jgi:hypothetical protein
MPDTPALPTSSDDREPLRNRVRGWTDAQRRLFVDRALETLRDEELVRLLTGLATPEEIRRWVSSKAESLPERVRRHAEATRAGDFRGDLLVRNDHGHRTPWQTDAWLATTGSLFHAALAACGADASAEPVDCLRQLCDLVREVDGRRDELVTFEDSCARHTFHAELARAARHLGAD